MSVLLQISASRVMTDMLLNGIQSGELREKSMNRIVIALILTGLSLIAIEQSSSADDEVHYWDEIRSGGITVPPVGAVTYEVAYTSVGFDHFDARVSVSWEDGELRSQVIFEGIHDKPPAKISVVGSQLCISVKYCQRYQHDCPVWSKLYSYDHRSMLFVGGAQKQQRCNDGLLDLPKMR